MLFDIIHHPSSPTSVAQVRTIEPSLWFCPYSKDNLILDPTLEESSPLFRSTITFISELASGLFFFLLAIALIPVVYCSLQILKPIES